MPYILAATPAFPLSIGFTGVAFFLVGASRSLVTRRAWYVNGVEMFVVGMLAAAVAFTVGRLLGGLARRNSGRFHGPLAATTETGPPTLDECAGDEETEVQHGPQRHGARHARDDQ